MVDLTSTQKTKLIDRVAREVYNNTDTWQDEGKLGSELAYLFWAMASDDFVEWSADEKPFKLFEKLFKDDDPVWAYIKVTYE